MRIQSLNQRDDVKESECDSEILFGMTRVVHTANSIVQHGSLDKIDLHKMEELA